jgi:NAD(P)-dependent dehydrogenase (short-subunit alcohol dehydrogenase family)
VNLVDKVIVITGGARGIGAALAERFAAERPKGVVVADLDLDNAELVAARLRDAGVPALAVRTDVAVKSEASQLITAAEDEFGPVDLLCSNAGIATGAGIHTAGPAWDLAWSVNVLGHVHLAQAVLPSMCRRRSGHIVITASAVGLLGLPGDAPYAVTKSACVALAEWLAVTYRRAGIGVSALCPLGVRTDLLMPAVRAGHPAARAVARFGGILEPAQVADAVVAGVADGSFFIFPHDEVGSLYAGKAADPESWIGQQSAVQGRG